MGLHTSSSLLMQTLFPPSTGITVQVNEGSWQGPPPSHLVRIVRASIGAPPWSSRVHTVATLPTLLRKLVVRFVVALPVAAHGPAALGDAVRVLAQTDMWEGGEEHRQQGFSTHCCSCLSPGSTTGRAACRSGRCSSVTRAAAAGRSRPRRGCPRTSGKGRSPH